MSAAPDSGPWRRSPQAAIDLAAELLQRGRAIELVNISSSMWPLVRAGDRLRIEPAVAARLGDLAAVRRGPALTVHRVVRVCGERITLMGDADGRPDAPATRADILGVVTLQWRGDACIDHRTAPRRLVGRTAALLARTTRLPWRMARLLARARRIVAPR